jgi:hypothetical protein
VVFNEFNSAALDYEMSDVYLSDLKEKHGPEEYMEILRGNGNPAYLKFYVACRKILISDLLLSVKDICPLQT